MTDRSSHIRPLKPPTGTTIPSNVDSIREPARRLDRN
jgi:hypothetical protein